MPGAPPDRADTAVQRPDRPAPTDIPVPPAPPRAEAAGERPERPPRRGRSRALPGPRGSAPTATAAARGALEPGRDAWAVIGRLATRQAGAVSRQQLREAGLQRSAVRHAVAGGRLLPRAGVLLVGHAAPSVDGELHRALLLAGSGAIVSHRTAAWVWGIGPRPPRFGVTVPSNRRARRQVELHRSRLDPRRDVTHRRGFAVTSLPRTVVDCAAVMSQDELARLVNEAAIRGWLPDGRAADLLARSRGRRGATALRRVLDARDRSRGWTRSSLERAFADLAREAGLPTYERGALVDIGGDDLRECDALWRALRVMVELDSLPIHETGHVPYRDRRRDRRLAAAGWTVIRITGEDLAHHRAEVIADLRRALRVERAEAAA